MPKKPPKQKRREYKTRRRRVVTVPTTPQIPTTLTLEDPISEPTETNDSSVCEKNITNNQIETNLPQHLLEEASVVLNSVVPEKSSDRYHHYFTELENWCSTEGVKIELIDENIMLAYFGRLIKGKNYSPSTLTSRLSAIRTIMISKGKNKT